MFSCFIYEITREISKNIPAIGNADDRKKTPNRKKKNPKSSKFLNLNIVVNSLYIL